ncbi:hypothetical protein [Glutamicibacter sp. PS]|uniref:hypothetical protein n=1 Tax=Glutamicibacter sp. PS TaxID=3075634 RepID=UPI002850D9A4|nr:hypothetical protein [Glutamicibacter sp. PS]MDR4533538.1 hypothetical protein [Glutamicibacter sp. PS]
MEPSSARVGDEVTVSAPAATCNPSYGEDAKVRVVLTDASGAEVLNTTAEMSDAGAFEFTFIIPDRTQTGTATVLAMPDALDWCDDTGVNNRLKSSEASIHRTACAEPARALEIVPELQ